MAQQLVVLNISQTIIGSNAFADLFIAALKEKTISGSETINIQINFGEGPVTISENAFNQTQLKQLLLNGEYQNITIGNAIVNFNANSQPTIGSNAFAELNVKNLQLPANTTLQANALQNLPVLETLDATLVNQPLVTNSLNLTRTTTAALTIQMPTSASATFSAGSVVIPKTSSTSTTTIVFGGSVPPASVLQNMFTVDASVAAPVKVAINYANNSNVSSEQIQKINQGLTSSASGAPNAVSYTAVQSGSTAVAGAALTSISQFAGDYFAHLPIAPANATNQLSQCVVIGLTPDAMSYNVANIAVPALITPITSTTPQNVIGLVSRMDVNGHDDSFYIVDNYYDPSAAALPSVPLVAIVSKSNAGSAVGGFSPAILCNGTIADDDTGSVIISGSVGDANSYCFGYNAKGNGTASNTAVNLLNLQANVGSVPLYDKSNSATTQLIGTFTRTDTTYTIQITPVVKTDFSTTPIVGCFEGYRPTLPTGTTMTADFTSLANIANQQWNSFSNSVAVVITNNNVLSNLLGLIRAQPVVAGTTAVLPATVVSISDELAALSKSDFNALAAWSALRSKYTQATTGYAKYLSDVKTYVDEAVIKLNAPNTIQAYTAMKPLADSLPSAILAVSNVLADNTTNPGSLYTDIVSKYISARLSIGIQAFKSCTVLGSIPNFEFLRNISKINDQTFNFCTSLKNTINIPVNVVSIGKRAYYNCGNAIGIDIQNALALRVIGESAFEGCQSMSGNLAFSSALGAGVSVTTIGNRAFMGCIKLTDHLYFPPGLTSIGVSAFENCSSLNGTIVFPNNVNFTVIPERAFNGCSNLTGVSNQTGDNSSLEYLPNSGLTGKIPNGLNIPPSVIKIGNSAFKGCLKFVGELNLQNGNAIQTIEDSAFENCSSFTSLVLPNVAQYKTISINCFKNCLKLVGLTIPPAVDTILDGAFNGCNKIANVPKLDNVKYIGGSSFYGCSGMTGPLVLGAYLDFIGDMAFFNCNFLTSATFLGPPTINIKSVTTIFGLTIAADIKFYVNVFTENGWEGPDLTTLTNLFGASFINTSFRAVNGEKSVVQLSFIDFNTYNPALTKDITIENYQSFIAFDNKGTAGINAVVANVSSWQDVYIPGILRGPTLVVAKTNIDQKSTSLSALSKITDLANIVQVDALNSLFRVNDLTREFNGGILAVAMNNGAPFALVPQAGTSFTPTAAPYFGVYNNSGVDNLYYSPAVGTAATLVTYANSNINFFVTSTDTTTTPTLALKYTNKIISVNSVGAIKVVSILPIGYDVPTGVTTSNSSTSATSSTKYTIVKGTTSLPDKMYLGALPAMQGAYFIASSTGPLTTKYNGNIIYVNVDGSITIPESQLNSSFEMISVANQKATVGDIVADTHAIVPGQMTGANTPFSLYYKSGTAPATVVNSGYYFIQSSDLPQFNNVVVLVNGVKNTTGKTVSNGGLSIGYSGVTGSNKALSNYVSALTAQSIPLYTDNVEYLNFENYLQNTSAQNFTKFSSARTNYVNAYTTYSGDFVKLNTQYNAIKKSIPLNTIGASLITAFNDLVTSNATLGNSNNDLNDLSAGKYNQYSTLISNLKEAATSSKDVSLATIQSNTMNDKNTGINMFQRNGVFSPTALSSPALPTEQNVVYVTAQLQAFLTAYLSQQKISKNGDFAQTVSNVNALKEFVVSPSATADKKAVYANLSVQQKILADFAVGMITRWYNSMSTAGGKQSFQSLYDAPEADIWTWAQTNIVAYFAKGGVNVYTQFVHNNVIPSLANIRTSISTYEQRKAAGDNNETASGKAQLAYINVSVVPQVTSSYTADTSTQAAPTAALTAGKLIFNNATLTSATKLYFAQKNTANADESFGGYADTIVITEGANSMQFKINSVSVDANANSILEVVFVSGTAVTNATPSNIRTYQTVSSHTLILLSNMVSYVFTQYNQTYADMNNDFITGIKNYLNYLKTALTTSLSTIEPSLNTLDNATVAAFDKINLVNVAEDSLSSFLKQSIITPASMDLAGAQMLVRELELFGYALNNQKNGNNVALPSVDSLPAYENQWFVDRVNAFLNSASSTQFTINDRQMAYGTMHSTFVDARYTRQTAMINSYIANSPPDANLVIPLLTAYIRELSFKIMSVMPGFIKTSANDLVAVIAQSVVAYVGARDTQLGTLVGDARALASVKYQQSKITSTNNDLKTANYNYSIATYNRYLATIDLAIANGYYGTLTGDADNEFKNALDAYKAGNALQKIAATSKIIPALFAFLYTTTAAAYPPTNFPLTASGTGGAPIISWFGDATRNGWLYQLSNNGYSGVLSKIQDNTIALTAYQLAEGTAASTIATALTMPSAEVYQTSLIASNTANGIKASELLVTYSVLHYNVVSIGYDSVSALPASPAPVPSTFKTVGSLPLAVVQDANNQNSFRYSFEIAGTSYYGYQQSAALMNSWASLSPNENVVIFYPGPTNLNAPYISSLYSASQNSITALCDNAAYVMIISPTSAFVGQVFSVYKYDAMGVNSGQLLAVGKLVSGAPVPTITSYLVTGAFQTVAQNPLGNTSGINLVGDIVIPNQIKTVGINSFAGCSSVKSLSFGAGSNNVSIGSNAFQGCNGLSNINLGSTIASIGPSAFLNCTSATSLTLPPLPSIFSTVNHWAFLGCSNLGSSATKANLALNTNLKQINVQAFSRCTKLQCSQLNGGSGLNYLPPQMQKIGTGAFLGCVGLTGAITFNNVNQNGAFISSIAILGSAAFMGCTGLNGEVSLPINSSYKNVLPYTFASMDAPMFDFDNALITTFPPQSAVPMKLIGAIDLSSGSVASSVTAIKRNAFYKCSSLSSLNISNSVSELGNQSFMFCSGLVGGIHIPAYVKSVGDEAFRGCSGLTTLSIASTMVSQTAVEAWLSLGNSCFRDCTSLAVSNTAGGLILPNTVASIGDRAFQGCTSIVSVNVGSGLSRANSFGDLVFSGCTKLERVIFAFSFVSKNLGAGQSVVKNATGATVNASFTGCTALGVPSDTPIGNIQIQSGATGWTPGRAAFFNNLTIIINNRNITFYLSEFNSKITVVDPTQEQQQTEAIPVTDAKASIYVKASDMRKVFRTATDSFVNQNVSGDSGVEHGQIFYVLPEYFPKYLNVANAHVVLGGIESYNASVYEQLVKDDVMRYYAMSLFNSADWVTLFANDTEMLENMVASSGLMPLVPDGETDDVTKKNLSNTGVLYKIMNDLNNISNATSNLVNPLMVQSTNYPSPTALNRWWGLPDTVTPEQGNIGRKLFNLINRNDPGRVTSMVLNGTTPSELPFLPGDEFIFKFTLNENKVTLSPELPPVVVKERKYLIKLVLTEDFNAGTPAFMDHAVALYTPSVLNKNVLPVSGAYAADYMYSNYNLNMVIKPSLLNQTTSSVYSKVTQNTYEPIPMPVSLLPFTGWYYSYPYNSQSIKLDFTPNLSLTDKTHYADLRYLTAYVYFPNTWNSVTVLPSADNFPQWVVTFTNDINIMTFKYKAGFLSANAETINFMGQTVPFDYGNTHIQLTCPFDLSTSSVEVKDAMNALLAGKTADGQQSGTINSIAGTFFQRQRSTLSLVSGLRKSSSPVGPFTYPPISRGYQCIPMGTTPSTGLTPVQVLENATALTNVAAVNGTIGILSGDTYRLSSVHLEINMTNNSGFVPSVIVKSVEVVTKNYDAYYLAPLDPN